MEQDAPRWLEIIIKGQLNHEYLPRYDLPKCANSSDLFM